MTIPTLNELQTALVRLVQTDEPNFHAIVTGGPTTDVTVAPGVVVPSIKKLMDSLASLLPVKGFDTKAAMDADLDYAADFIAFVTDDPTDANNWFYRKVGGTGTGSWSKANDSVLDALLALAASSFTQTGTGAVSQGIDVKLRESPISPEDFGAVGDGITDDAGHLQACIDEGIANKRVVRFKAKTYLTNTRLTANNVSGAAYPGPMWEGVPYSTKIKAGPSLTSGHSLIKWRGVPNPGDPLATTYFRGGFTRGIQLDGTSSTHVCLEIMGIAYHTFEKMFFTGGLDGIKTTLDLAYNANPDYTASQNCSIKESVFQSLSGVGYNDSSPMSAVGFHLDRIQTLFCLGGGAIVQSTQFKMTQSGIAYSGFTIGLTPAGSPVVGLIIGDGAGASGAVQDVILEGIEFDENKDYNLKFLGCNRVRMDNTRHIVGQAMGTKAPLTAFVAFGNGVSAVRHVRGHGHYLRLDSADAITAFSMGDGANAEDIHLTGLDVNNAGGGTLTKHSGFTDGGRNLTNDFFIADQDGTVLVPGKYLRTSGGMNSFTVATAPTPDSNDFRLAYCTNGNAGSPCIAAWTGAAWKVVGNIGATISAT